MSHRTHLRSVGFNASDYQKPIVLTAEFDPKVFLQDKIMQYVPNYAEEKPEKEARKNFDVVTKTLATLGITDCRVFRTGPTIEIFIRNPTDQRKFLLNLDIPYPKERTFIACDPRETRDTIDGIILNITQKLAKTASASKVKFVVDTKKHEIRVRTIRESDYIQFLKDFRAISWDEPQQAQVAHHERDPNRPKPQEVEEISYYNYPFGNKIIIDNPYSSQQRILTKSHISRILNLIGAEDYKCIETNAGFTVYFKYVTDDTHFEAANQAKLSVPVYNQVILPKSMIDDIEKVADLAGHFCDAVYASKNFNDVKVHIDSSTKAVIVRAATLQQFLDVWKKVPQQDRINISRQSADVGGQYALAVA